MQLQNDLWCEAKKKSKPEIIAFLKTLGEDGPVSNHNKSVFELVNLINWSRVSTLLGKPKNDNKDEPESTNEENTHGDIAWLPEAVLEDFASTELSGIQQDLCNIEQQLNVSSDESHQILDNNDTNEHGQKHVSQKCCLTPQELQKIHQTLLPIHKRWKDTDTVSLANMFGNESAKKLMLLTKRELDVIAEGVEAYQVKKGKMICKSWPKDKKVNTISDLVGDGSHIESSKRRKSNHSPLQLCELTLKVIKNFPKQSLNAVYAVFKYSENYKKWIKACCPKAVNISRLIANVTEVMHHRQDPSSRNFLMRTTRKPFYPARKLELDETTKLDSTKEESSEVPYPLQKRDHYFDTEERARTKRNRKTSSISRPSEPGRGVQPVREHFKTNESKILPERRLGID